LSSCTLKVNACLLSVSNIAAAGTDVDVVNDDVVMEQSIGQDEQANKFSAELRIRKTQVFVVCCLCHRFLSVNYSSSL